MNLILANKADLNSIMNIIQEAQIYLASLNVDQWQDGYPGQEIILNDIFRQECFIVKDESDSIMGMGMFTMQAEPTYSKIEGAWLTSNNSKYGVIHRMAVGNKYRNSGVAKFIINKCEQKLKNHKINSMRIDTHKDNKGMQGLLNRLGYVYCGIIFLDKENNRMAFEKILK